MKNIIMANVERAMGSHVCVKKYQIVNKKPDNAPDIYKKHYL